MRTITGLTFLGGIFTVVLEVKPATTFDEQIELLQKRGLIISNKPKPREILSCLNYYTFTGYLHDFKVDGDRYHSGITFEEKYRIIEFDRRLWSILTLDGVGCCR